LSYSILKGFASMPNTNKHISYKEAWERIDSAIKQKFYFEAVTICESIISDRLISYLQGVDESSEDRSRHPFAKLIKDWQRLGQTEIPNRLSEDVDNWRYERNMVVHNLVKSAPGAPTEDLQSFLQRAEKAAKDGARLARKVSNWHRQQLRKHKAATVRPD